MATTNECNQLIYNYFKKKYPNNPDIKLVKHPWDTDTICEIPKSLQDELQLFVDGFSIGYDTCKADVQPRIDAIKVDVNKLKNAHSVDKELLRESANNGSLGYQMGYKEGYRLGQGLGVKLVEDEARKWKKSYLDLQKEFDTKITEAKNESYVFGVEAGRNAELAEAVIPSDAFNIEVFAVKPADDGVGLQAFVGYQFKHNDTTQFRFTQINYAVTNPTNKYVNNNICKNNEETCIKTNS